MKFTARHCTVLTLMVCAIACILNSCTKDAFITDKNALLLTSADTLHFDTVFTTVGSTTQSFKIFNLNNQKIRLNRLALSGGSTSNFHINLNGVPGTSFSDIDIAANDSIYVFVAVTIDPQAPDLPFIVQDSIQIEYNQNTKYVQLDAYGQNAHFLNNTVITHDTSWSNELPFVITGSLTINTGQTLTINKGVKVYAHADAPILVNGSLHTSGEKYDSTRITFSGDRLDEDYKNLPGSWPGIFFSPTSNNNILEYTTIRNCLQGIVIESNSPGIVPKLTLKQCIITNVLDAGIVAVNSGIRAENCLIANCGGANINLQGGSHKFFHCTMASYSNLLLNHTSPVLVLTDRTEAGNIFPLDAEFTNSILYGESGLFDDEISATKYGADFSVKFTNVLFKSPGASLVAQENCIQNQDPQFTSIDIENNFFDFHLQPFSPCINAGADAGLAIDLDGNPRDISVNSPDIGCYESQ